MSNVTDRWAGEGTRKDVVLSFPESKLSLLVRLVFECGMTFRGRTTYNIIAYLIEILGRLVEKSLDFFFIFGQT